MREAGSSFLSSCLREIPAFRRNLARLSVLHLREGRLAIALMTGSTFFQKCGRKLSPMVTPASVSRLDLVVCACGQQEYTARDAVETALFRGELDEKWNKFLRDIAAEDQADELDLDLDEAAISAAADAFRYERDLITTEETESWLTTRCLTLDDFNDYFARRYYASTLREDVMPDEADYQTASPELRELFVTDSLLSGELDRMTEELMRRLASRCAEPDPSPEAVFGEQGRFLEGQSLKVEDLPAWLTGLGRDSQWLNEMVALEAAYRKHCETVLIPRARQRELAVLRLPLTRIEMEVIELESHDAAQEALFCVRDDGMSMEEVAAEDGYPYRHTNFLLEDIPADAQERFLSASPGDILEPMTRGDGFELYRVLSKTEPHVGDPGVQSRIDRRLLDRHFSELTSKYIQRRLGTSAPAG
jgi:hypothetical protein